MLLMGAWLRSNTLKSKGNAIGDGTRDFSRKEELMEMMLGGMEKTNESGREIIVCKKI